MPVTDSDLARALAELEARQRSDEPAPGAPVRRIVAGVRIPPQGRLPRSEALLARLYAGDFVPREKKPLVVDTRRSAGAMLVSVDEPPLAVIDACSQIATVTHGLSADPIRKALHDGAFASCLWVNPDTTVQDHPVLSAYARTLLRFAPPGLRHVAFVAAGGAEANEKALWLARLAVGGGARRRRVLAFRGSFHGRTLVALGATWNPRKRGPFEMDGFEAVFADPTPDGAARAVEEHGGEIYAAIVEPMMAEGGDLHHGAAFYRALRSATRRAGVPLVVDEVQTGFATGGPFLWWRRLGLGGPGDPDTSPDFVTLAKKAQLGVVLSSIPDPAPVPVHVASALRGHLQALTAFEQHRGLASVAERLAELAERYPDLVQAPRAAGTTFAFDLPSSEHLARFIDQRFARGMMVYGAGTRTVRFRLGAAFDDRLVAELFQRIGEALARIDDPERTEMSMTPPVPERSAVRVRPLVEADWAFVADLESRAYEPARRTGAGELRRAAEQGFAWVAEVDGRPAGMAFAVPLEDVTGPLAPLDGPAQDPTLGTGQTLYSVDLTVAPEFRGRGVGRALKEAQVEAARAAGFRFVASRNRVGSTDAMTAINRSLGAFADATYAEQYGGEAATLYLRIPLAPPPVEPPADPPGLVDLATGHERPFRRGAPGLARRDLEGPLASRVNLSNYATVDVVHYVEHLRLLAPRGTRHVYFTSSRDEMVDKCLRCLRLSRPEAQVAVGLSGGYVGHTTAAARSLSDPAGFPAPFGLFGFPRIPHPSEAGVPAAVEAFESVAARHGAERIFGLFVEVVGERSGRVLAPEAAAALAEACRRHEVPLVVVESSTGAYRSGAGPWGLCSWPEEVVPDAVLWHPGGQLGHVFVGDRYYVGDPLTLISTWDGDEVCVVRTHETLRAAARCDLARKTAALGELAGALARRVGGEADGMGLYRAVRTDPETAARIGHAAEAVGVRLGRGAPGVVLLAPAFDVTPEEIVTARRRLLPVLAASLGAA